jgi:predicted membrane protein
MADSGNVMGPGSSGMIHLYCTLLIEHQIYMDILNVRTWIFFYLICFVALLWAVFLLIQGMMLWVGLTLVLIVVGFNFILVASEMRGHKKQEQMMKNITSMKTDSIPGDKNNGK